DYGHRVHESPWVMLGPLVVLAIGSIVAGWVGVPESMGGHDRFEHFLAPATTPSSGNETRILVLQVTNREGENVAQAPSAADAEAIRQARERLQRERSREEWVLAGTSVFVAALGLFFAWLLYYKRPELPDRITAKIHGLYVTVLHKYYVDEAYG